MIDIDPKGFDNLRLPKGTEAGANEKFLKGGKTTGGVSEAVLDNVAKDSEFVKTTKVQ